MPRFQVTINKCKVCDKTVYPMEELIADNDHYHKPCFRCSKCNRTLSTGTYASLDGAIFCKPHFLQLFKQKGNYEEGFGKERYKNKWNGPNSKLEITSSGQAVSVKDPVAVLDTDAELKGNVVNGSVAIEQPKAFSNGINHTLDHTDHAVNEEDSTDGGVEEESGPISLQYKKSKLFEKASPEPQAKHNTPGKLKGWQPVSSRHDDSISEKPKPPPKKLNINWSARTQERAAERGDNEQPLKFTDMGDVKTKFETGQIGKKEFKSESSVEVIPVSQGKAQSAKDSFENRAERQYDSTKRKELEELKIARTLAASKPTEDDSEDLTNSRIEEENSRYRELEEFKKAAAARQNLSKFEGGAFSNVEQSEIETRKEVETILGSGKAADTLKIYESGEYEKKEYSSPAKQELGSIKADTSTKKNLYESGGESKREYESEAKKELENITAVAGETRNKFESGQLLNNRSQNEERVGELEEIRSVSAAGDKKNKFESGELIRKEFGSDARKEIETMKTDASEFKTKYESGELIRTEFDSDVKKELETMSTGAMDKKNKYDESGDLETREYDSVARKEAEEVKKLSSSSSIKSKYRDAVQEGNKIATSKPVTIEKAPPGEDPFISRSDDEDFKVTYVPAVEPKRMTNIEERFKKAEVEKPAPNVNRIKIPTFEKTTDSDEEVNGHIPDEEEVAKLKEQMWPKNTSSIKSMFESKRDSADEQKDAPQQIDLQAEISAYKEHVKKNRPRRHKANKNQNENPVGPVDNQDQALSNGD